MAIVKDKKTGKYKYVKSPPSYYKAPKSSSDSSGSRSSKTVPYDFVGPLQPGTTREAAPVVYSGPVQPGTDTETFRRTGSSSRSSSTSDSSGSRSSKTVPYDFVGPLQPGTTREAAPAQAKAQAEAQKQAEAQAKALEQQQSISQAQQFQEMLRRQSQAGLTDKQREIQDKYFGYSIKKPKSEEKTSIPEKIREYKVEWKKQLEEAKKLKELRAKEGKEKLKEYYEQAGYEVSPSFSVGAITGMTTSKERAEALAPVTTTLKGFQDVAEKTSIMPVFNKNAITYDETTGEWVKFKDKYPDRKFVTFGEMKKDVVKIQKQLGENEYNKRYNRAKSYTDKIYGDELSKIIYQQNQANLDSNKITWDEAISKSEKTKEYKDFIKKYTKTFTSALGGKTPKEIALGIGESYLEIFPSTYAGMALTTYGVGKAAGAVGGRKVAGVALSDPITQISQNLYDIVPSPKSFTGQLAKGAGAAALMGPTIGTAYATELGKGLLTDPFETTAGLAEWGIEKPGEFIGFGLGGRIRGKIKGRKEIKLQEREFAKYDEAKANYESLKKTSRFADTTSPVESYSLGQKAINIELIKNKPSVLPLEIKKDVIKQAEFIEVSQSVSEIVKRLPVLKKIPVPKTSPLYRRLRNTYTTYLTEIIRYKNTINYTIGLKNGRQVTYSFSSVSKKPLPKFKNIESALKYGSGKKLIISKAKAEVPGFVTSNVYEYRAGKYKPADSFLGKIDSIIDPITKKEYKKVTIGKKPEVSKLIPDRLDIGQLYSYSPKVSESILKIKEKPTKKKIAIGRESILSFDEFLTGQKSITRVRDFVLDTSIAQRIIENTIKRTKNIKPNKRTIGQKAAITLSNKIDKAKKENRRNVKISSNLVTKLSPTIKNKIITAQVSETIPTSVKIRYKQDKPKIKTEIKSPTIDSIMGFVKTEKPVFLKRKRQESITQFAPLTMSLTEQKSRQKQIQKERQKQIYKRKTETIKTQSIITTPTIFTPTGRFSRIQPRTPTTSLLFDRERYRKPTKKIFKKKPTKKKKPKYVAQITGFEAALGLGPRYVEAGKKFTGFEAVRGRVINKKGTKKTPIKKGTKKPKDNWGLY